MKSDLKTAIKHLIGKKCWAVSGGKGTGSMFKVALGKKVKREFPLKKFPLKNKHLSKHLRYFDGEFRLFVQCCAWRLQKKNKVICSSTETQETIGFEIKKLVGHRISQINLLNSALDLSVEFDKMYTLTLFCDQTYEPKPLTNYTVFCPEGSYSVEARSKLDFACGGSG